MEVSFLIDQVTMLFTAFLLLIVGVICLFIEEYMGGDLLVSRFRGILYRFVGAMVLLIVSSNLLFLLVG